MRLSPGWCASARTPPTTMPPAEICSNVLPVTDTVFTPSPTPLVCPLASLPMPMPTWPRFVNLLALKEMALAADTWTAAGIWLKPGRVDSNWPQPEPQLLNPSAGLVLQVPLM